MALGDILTSYQLTPEAEARFSKSVIRNIHGSVRTNLGSLPAPIALFVILGMLESVLFRVYGGLIGMVTLILYLFGTLLFFWELMSFRIDFDGSTGFVQYHTLLRGTTTYHIDELMMFDVNQQRLNYNTQRIVFRGRRLSGPNSFDFSNAFRARGTLRIREILTITTASHIIVVPLASAWLSSKLVHGVGGFVDSEKFFTYLDLYRRFMLKHEPISDLITEENADLSPAVRAAIAAQKQTAAQTAKQAQPLPESIPALTAEDADPASIERKNAVTEQFSTPDLSVPVTGIPETHVLPQKFDQNQQPVETPPREEVAIAEAETAAAFPDPAQKPAAPAKSDTHQKSSAEVDELFNNVLRQFGKL